MTNSELKSIRQSLNLSKSDFAKKIGIAPVVEGKYEKGSLDIPEEVIQAVFLLKNKMENESEHVFEGSNSVVNETLEMETSLDPKEDHIVSEISTVEPNDELTMNEMSAEENTVKQMKRQTDKDNGNDKEAGLKNSMYVKDINTSTIDSSLNGFDNAMLFLPAVIPFVIPSLFMTNYLIGAGFFLKQTKRIGLFRLWW